MQKIIHFTKPKLLGIRRNLIIGNKPLRKLFLLNTSNPLDKNILTITNSASINYLMGPLVGFIDAFWISKLGSTLELAGQGFADDIYNLIFSIFCFFSSFITPEISKLNSEKEKDLEEISSLISTTILTSLFIGIMVSILYNLVAISNLYRFIPNDNILNYSQKYLRYRSITVCFAMINNTIFAIMRGLFLFKTAFKLNLLSQIINLILDPIFMFYFGIKGVAIASGISEIICSIQYLLYLNQNKYITLKIVKFKQIIQKIFNSGVLIQIRNICYKLIYLLMLNKILKIDFTGQLVASYVICTKIIELGNIFYYGLGTVGYTLIPSERSKDKRKRITSRLFYWGNLFLIVELLFIGNFYFTSKLLTNDKNVVILIINSLPYILSLLYLQGLGNIYDGILQGYQKYSYQTIISIISLILSTGLFYLSKTYNQIWISIIFISGIRLFLLKIFNNIIKN